MLTGILTVKMHLPTCTSLKEKRQIIQSLKKVIGNKFNVSVAETSDQDLWQKAELGFAIVGTSRDLIDKEFSLILDKIENCDGASLTDHFIEFVRSWSETG